MKREEQATQIEELMSQAWQAQGEAKLALLEEAQRLADSSGDVEAGLEIRNEIIDAATWCGYYERSLVAFNWMLAQCDRVA